MLPDGDKLTLAGLAASAGRSGCSFGLLRFAEFFLILGDIDSLPARRETSENPSQFYPDLERAHEKGRTVSTARRSRLCELRRWRPPLSEWNAQTRSSPWQRSCTLRRAACTSPP